MPLSELLIQGLELLLLGVVVLFGFMAFLHVLVGRMTQFCVRHEPCQAFPIARPVHRPEAEQERVAAIAVAIHLYRNRSRRRALQQAD
ncbi:MAG: hypothetical protein HQL80_04235 [Magnetococcales bacterium]|nr:hypothetical protein [Magnetococcales bacterium]MBF0583427.1 hypothetical protein [Magnetococcales bacterium]